jgi:septal ring factor EnvC (AmiA/AmiB activator)
MTRPKSLHAPFKSAKPEVQRYIVALESENAKLHRQIATFEAQDVTKQHRITALEKEMKELTKKHGFQLIVDMSGKRSQKPVDPKSPA